jgi:hypothetical protein
MEFGFYTDVRRRPHADLSIHPPSRFYGKTGKHNIIFSAFSLFSIENAGLTRGGLVWVIPERKPITDRIARPDSGVPLLF